MGQGKRVVNWFKKKFFGKRMKSGSSSSIKKKKDKKNKLSDHGGKATPSQQSISGDSQKSVITGESPDVTLQEYLRPNAAAVTPDSLEVQTSESFSTFPDISDLDDDMSSSLNSKPDLGSDPELGILGCEKNPNHPPPPLLPPIEEEYRNAKLKPRALPKIDITTTKLGNVAFEVSLMERPITPTPARFSVSSASKREECGAKLSEKMDKVECNRLTALKARSESLKEKSKLAKESRQRKSVSSLRPLVHGSSLLGELPCTPDITTRPSSRGGVAFTVDTASHRPATPRPSWVVHMERAIEKSKTDEDKEMDESQRQLACKLQDKMNTVTQNRSAHLSEIHEHLKKEKKRAEAVRARKEIAYIKPIVHGSSLLNELPSTPNIEARPPSRGGVAFHMDSGSYRPSSMPSVMKVVHRALTEKSQQSEKQVIEELSMKVNKKMDQVTRNRKSRQEARQGYLRGRFIQAMEVKERKTMSHRKPLAHGMSLLESLPHTGTILVRPPSQGGVAFHLDLQDKPCKNARSVLETDWRFVRTLKHLDTINEAYEEVDDDDDYEAPEWIIEENRMYLANWPEDEKPPKLLFENVEDDEDNDECIGVRRSQSSLCVTDDLPYGPRPKGRDGPRRKPPPRFTCRTILDSTRELWAKRHKEKIDKAKKNCKEKMQALKKIYEENKIKAAEARRRKHELKVGVEDPNGDQKVEDKNENADGPSAAEGDRNVAKQNGEDVKVIAADVEDANKKVSKLEENPSKDGLENPSAQGGQNIDGEDDKVIADASRGLEKLPSASDASNAAPVNGVENGKGVDEDASEEANFDIEVKTDGVEGSPSAGDAPSAEGGNDDGSQNDKDTNVIADGVKGLEKLPSASDATNAAPTCGDQIDIDEVVNPEVDKIKGSNVDPSNDNEYTNDASFPHANNSKSNPCEDDVNKTSSVAVSCPNLSAKPAKTNMSPPPPCDGESDNSKANPPNHGGENVYHSSDENSVSSDGKEPSGRKKHGNNGKNDDGSDSSQGEDSLADRPKLRRVKKNISFSSKVKVKVISGEEEESHVMHVDIQDESDSEVKRKRARFNEWYKGRRPRRRSIAVRRRLYELAHPNEPPPKELELEPEYNYERYKPEEREESGGEEEAESEVDGDEDVVDKEQAPKLPSHRDDLEDDDDDDDDDNDDDDWVEKFKPLPCPLVFEPLPLRFASNVDTRIRPTVPPEARRTEYNEFSDTNPVHRRRYFVYENDRMKDPKYDYNLNEDRIVPASERYEIIKEKHLRELERMERERKRKEENEALAFDRKRRERFFARKLRVRPGLPSRALVSHRAPAAVNGTAPPPSPQSDVTDEPQRRSLSNARDESHSRREPPEPEERCPSKRGKSAFMRRAPAKPEERDQPEEGSLERGKSAAVRRPLPEPEERGPPERGKSAFVRRAPAEPEERDSPERGKSAFVRRVPTELEERGPSVKGDPPEPEEEGEAAIRSKREKSTMRRGQPESTRAAAEMQGSANTAVRKDGSVQPLQPHPPMSAKPTAIRQNHRTNQASPCDRKKKGQEEPQKQKRRDEGTPTKGEEMPTNPVAHVGTRKKEKQGGKSQQKDKTVNVDRDEGTPTKGEEMPTNPVAHVGTRKKEKQGGKSQQKDKTVMNVDREEPEDKINYENKYYEEKGNDYEDDFESTDSNDDADRVEDRSTEINTKTTVMSSSGSAESSEDYDSTNESVGPYKCTRQESEYEKCTRYSTDAALQQEGYGEHRKANKPRPRNDNIKCKAESGNDKYYYCEYTPETLVNQNDEVESYSGIYGSGSDYTRNSEEDNLSSHHHPIHYTMRPPPYSPPKRNRNYNSMRRRHYRRQQQPHNVMENTTNQTGYGYLAQSVRQVNITEISASAGGYTRMPPINPPGQRGLVGTVQGGLAMIDEGRYQDVPPVNRKKLMERRESRCPNMIVKLEQEKPRLYLPAVNNGPVICQPLDINDPPEVRRKKQEREAAKKRKYRPNLTGRHSNPNYHDY